MAIRNIITQEDPALHKTCRPVTDFDERLWQLLDDMAETLHKADGVGLAAPQVGVLRRLFIMDFGEGVIEAINPEIVERKGKDLTARCICHENDHLDGILFKEHVIRMLDPD